MGMCTLIAALSPGSPWPLVVAANRDERLDRPASPPSRWEGNIPFLAPRDELAGGTWLGLNEAGLFVGVTNRFGHFPDAQKASRGALVTWALGHPSATALHQALSSLPVGRYNPFHLFYADRSGAGVTWDDGGWVQQASLGPGVHVITERSLGGDDGERTEAIRARLARLGPAPTDEEWMGVLCEARVDLPHLGYGTRSSLVMRLPGNPADPESFLWTDANPCEGSFQQFGQGLPLSPRSR